MSDAQTVIIALQTLISLSLLGFGLFFLHRDFFIERFRDGLFQLRGELFDFAASGGIPFAHPAYGLLRTILNGHIRFAHQLSILRLLSWGFELGRDRVGQQEVVSFSRRWADSISTLDDGVRQELLRIRGSMHRLVFRQLLVMSPLFFLAILPGFVASKAAERVLQALRQHQWVNNAEANTDFVVYECRSAA